MKNIEGLVEDAVELAQQGHTKGEIADELNVSRETATWLVSRSEVGTAPATGPNQPHDIHVDWSALGLDGVPAVREQADGHGLGPGAGGAVLQGGGVGRERGLS